MVKIKHFFWTIAIFGLVFNPSFFSKSDLAVASSPSAAASVKPIFIKVIQAESSSVIVAENSLPAAGTQTGSCLAPQPGPNELLHEQGGINLNQPAGCIPIRSIAPAKVNFGKLAVLSLPQTYQQIVAMPTVLFIAAPSLSRSGGAGTYPLTLPGVSLVFLAIFIASEEKLKQAIKSRLLYITLLGKKILSPFELMVLRC